MSQARDLPNGDECQSWAQHGNDVAVQEVRQRPREDQGDGQAYPSQACVPTRPSGRGYLNRAGSGRVAVRGVGVTIPPACPLVNKKWARGSVRPR